MQQLLAEYFDGKHLQKTVNPDEVVAYGAAIQASVLNEAVPELFDCIGITDVTPLSLLGIRIASSQLFVIIKRNTAIPYTCTQEFVTSINNQTCATYDIYQGEEEKAEDNHFLGSFQIFGSPLRPAGEVTSSVTFSIDDDGVLHVDATIDGTELVASLDVKLTENRLSEEEVKRIVDEAKCT